MVFSSIPFLFFFLPICFFLYFLVPFKWKNFILLVFSLIFYAWGEPIYILLMVFSSVVDYFNGRFIYKYKDSKRKKLFLIGSILINLSVLGFFKYSDFLIQNLNTIFHLNLSLLHLSLPIGISFYTFQTMSYSIDVYRGEVVPEKNFLTFMTYVSMFPQLVAGPIVRYETVNQELHEREINCTNFANGFMRMLRGLFKKILLANTIGMLFSVITSSEIQNISVATAWLGILAYSLQIYFDFSGYSDMAIGIGEMLGFHFLENFNYPYISTSITDFWRRWHISLSSWFRDYVYIPLGGSRVKKIFHIRNILIVWALTGLWHGAAWNFILWGLYYGLFLLFEKFIFQKYLDKLPSFLRHIYAIFFIMIGWFLFAFDDFEMLKLYATRLFSFRLLWDQNFLYYLLNYGFVLLLGILFSIPIYPKLQAWMKKMSFKSSLCIIFFVYVLLFVITLAFLVSDTYNPFLYFRF